MATGAVARDKLKDLNDALNAIPLFQQLGCSESRLRTARQ